jgi:hypothetical protein
MSDTATVEISNANGIHTVTATKAEDNNCNIANSVYYGSV